MEMFRRRAIHYIAVKWVTLLRLGALLLFCCFVDLNHLRELKWNPQFLSLTDIRASDRLSTSTWMRTHRSKYSKLVEFLMEACSQLERVEWGVGRVDAKRLVLNFEVGARDLQSSGEEESMHVHVDVQGETTTY